MIRFIGGRLLLEWNGELVVGEVLSVDPPRLLLMEWRVDLVTSRVEARLFPTLDGTRLEVTHHGLTSEDLRARLDHGWQASLERLHALIAAI